MLIGLNGKKQAGKDTVYERMLRLYGPDSQADIVVERVSFADLLYESAAASLGVTVDFLRAYKSDPRTYVSVTGVGGHVLQEVTIREYLQRYGTEAHRNVFGGDFWVDNVDLSHDRKLVLVTDVRFPNEAVAVSNAGGHVVKVVGPAEVEDVSDGHASEAPLPVHLVDDVLFNRNRDDEFRTLDYNIGALVSRLMRRLRGDYEAVRRP